MDLIKSQTGYVITYAGCPLIWASKLQTTIALSSTEAEYYALLAALCEVIPLMDLIKELQLHGHDVPNAKPNIHCLVFKDSSGALEMAQVPKIHPRTRHVSLAAHHFRTHVEQGLISIHACKTVI